MPDPRRRASSSEGSTVTTDRLTVLNSYVLGDDKDPIELGPQADGHLLQINQGMLGSPHDERITVGGWTAHDESGRAHLHRRLALYRGRKLAGAYVDTEHDDDQNVRFQLKADPTPQRWTDAERRIYRPGLLAGREALAELQMGSTALGLYPYPLREAPFELGYNWLSLVDAVDFGVFQVYGASLGTIRRYLDRLYGKWPEGKPLTVFDWIRDGSVSGPDKPRWTLSVWRARCRAIRQAQESNPDIQLAVWAAHEGVGVVDPYIEVALEEAVK